MRNVLRRPTILLLLLLIPANIRGQERKSEEVYKSILPSVMTLVVEKKDGSVVTGTAFLAIKDGLAITAWHVIRNGARAIARFASGEEFEVSGVVDKDEKRDIAIIRVKVFGRATLGLAAMQPDVGSRVYVIGAPKGLEFTISDGLLSQVRDVEGVRQYQFSCPASPGNSGGPLVSSSGEVIGVVSWQFRDGQNLNFAVPSNFALGLDSSLPTHPLDSVRPSEPIVAEERAAPRPIAEVLRTARTLCVYVTQGSPLLKTEISGKLIRWGRLSLVSSPTDADLTLFVVQTSQFNAMAGEGNQATALLKERSSGIEMWSTTKGGSWSLSGYRISSVARDMADAFMKFFEKTVKDSPNNKK